MQASQQQPARQASLGAQVIELSGLSELQPQTAWQVETAQTQHDHVAAQIKGLILKAMMYQIPILSEEPASAKFIANAVAHEIMSMTTTEALTGMEEDTRHVALIVLHSLATRTPSISELMLLDAARTTQEPPSMDSSAGHALLTHIGNAILQCQSLPQVTQLAPCLPKQCGCF